VCAIEATQQTILYSRSRSIEQNIPSIAYGGAYFELVWSHGMNAPGLFSFEGNLVHLLWDCSITESKVQSRGDNEDTAFRSTNANADTQFALNAEESSILVNQ